MDSPDPVDETRLEEDPSYRLDHLRKFMGFDEEDWRLIQRSEPLVRDHLRDLVENLYERLMRFEPTARFYREESGELDQKAYEHRVEGFVLWFERIFDWEKNERYFDYLRDVGMIHTRRKGFEDMHVNPFYMLPTFGVLMEDLAELLGRGMEDSRELARTSAAWSRFFLIQMDLVRQAYRDPED